MNDKEFDLLVFIGRFQPFHLEHKRVIDIAMERAKHVLVLVGSSGKARTVRNPFTFAERRRMIQENYPHPLFGNGSEAYALPAHHAPKLIIEPLYDKVYNDSAWIMQVQDIVEATASDIANQGRNERIFRRNSGKDLKIGLIGASKDHTSYYLDMFPQWDSVDVKIENEIHATAIREGFISGHFERFQLETVLVPTNVAHFLFGHQDEHGFIDTSYYQQLRNELEHVNAYKKSWAVAPYPVKHMTVDAVVEQSGHVLLVRRKAEPGKNLYALPGGHLEVDERVADGVIRELREETKIKVPDPVLRGSVVNAHLFDDPHRSTIGRVITYAQHIRLPNGSKLPKVKGSDDADKAFWVPIADLEEEKFFDDHYHIIQYFLGI